MSPPNAQKHQLQRLKYEWLNSDDNGAMAIAVEQRERDEVGQPPMTVAEVEHVKRQFSAIHAELHSISHLTWPQTLCLLAEREYGRRASANPRFVALLLHALDIRQIAVTQIQKSLNMPLGHLFRFLSRAGIEFRSKTDENKLSRVFNCGDISDCSDALRDPINSRIFIQAEVRQMPDDSDWWESLDSIKPKYSITRPPVPPKLPYWLRPSKGGLVQAGAVSK